jgi:hypothetical protein
MNKITLFSLLAAICMLGIGQMAYADTAIISASPSTISKTVDAPFNVSIQLNPTNNQVCVVQGTLNLTNLSFQSITVASGIMAQTSPTCANPNFVLGIPKCTTAAQNILSVAVEGNQAGSASLSLSGVRAIGSGVTVASSVQGGSYNITARQATPVAKPAVNNNGAVVSPAQQPTQEITTPIDQTTSGTNIPASSATASFASVASAYFWPILIILIILAVIYIIYISMKGKKKTN